MVEPFLLTLDKNAKNPNTISESLRDLASDSSHARLLSIAMFSPKPSSPPLLKGSEKHMLFPMPTMIFTLISLRMST